MRVGLVLLVFSERRSWLAGRGDHKDPLDRSVKGRWCAELIRVILHDDFLLVGVALHPDSVRHGDAPVLDRLGHRHAHADDAQRYDEHFLVEPQVPG
ncbi:hypothetical protein CALCODRAFT_491002 [Calocera cornea HHB12733]|uniref:Uncharacterized protein n=1 Tax=Calocera cornea HHB12733 TaxID=1353952 RepID=A0A165JEN1_9BASI|nr:hypothetical protein CALCODRAFT_491002 [Calocera cornea HHB12733]